MAYILSSHGKFHIMDAAAALHERGLLTRVFTGYPRSRLDGYKIPPEKLTTLPLTHVPYMGLRKFESIPESITSLTGWADHRTYEMRVARRLHEKAKVFIGMSSSALLPGKVAKSRDMRFVLDRGSTHIRHQNEVLRAAHADLGMTYREISARTIEQELAEYSEADRILIPSQHCKDTFVNYGVESSKLRVVPYGVDLTKYKPLVHRCDTEFNVVFVGQISVRKQVHKVVDAFREGNLPNARLKIIGGADTGYKEFLRRSGRMSTPNVTFTGPLHGSELISEFSAAHVLVLPSVEEGLALVQAQAMACGCPVIASAATGASDLFQHGLAGLITDGSTSALTDALAVLASDRELLNSMSEAAKQRVSEIGGWTEYAQNLVAATDIS